MALGKKYMLKRKVKDPETGEEIWVEHKPDIARHLCAIFAPSLGSDRFAIFGVHSVSVNLRLGHRAPGRGGRRASIPFKALPAHLSSLGAFCLFELRVF
jgi:hypothetical protein